MPIWGQTGSLSKCYGIQTNIAEEILPDEAEIVSHRTADGFRVRVDISVAFSNASMIICTVRFDRLRRCEPQHFRL
jgi:pyruvate carboxylase